MRVLAFLAVLMLAGLALAPTAAQSPAPIDGVWQTDGYGWVFDIGPDHVTAYQATTTTCTAALLNTDITYSAEAVTLNTLQFTGLLGLAGFGDDLSAELWVEGETLYFDADSIVPLSAKRLPELPVACTAEVANPDDPEYNFEVFWHFFAENYAFFDLYGVDWQATYDTYRPQVTADTRATDLYEILSAMLTPLEDGHVNLVTAQGQFSPSPNPSWLPDEESYYGYLSLIGETYLGDAYQVAANDLISYGRLSPTLGYINLLAMSDFGEDDVATLNAVLPVILDELGEVEALVIDVRFNGGGADVNSVTIAGYFTATPYLAFTKQVWDGQAYGSVHEIWVEPLGDAPYLGDVYLLTSGLSVSAAETFVLAMQGNPRVTTVGETTDGSLSDMQFVFLPNGWLATLSNERYGSHAGVYYEGGGIPPMLEVTMSLEAMQAGTDPVLEAVMAQANQP